MNTCWKAPAMFDTLVVFQSYTGDNPFHVTKDRYVGAPKLEISKRCFRSVINTINHCKSKEPDVNYRMIVSDDGSDQEFIDLVKEQAKIQDFSIDLVQHDHVGVMPSMLNMYQLGLDRGKDIVYFAQDDYLHYETALWEMIDGYVNFKHVTQMRVCMFPYDYPIRYNLHRYNYKLLLGAKRHWRTAYHAAVGMLLHHSTLKEFWECFEKIGYVEYDENCEDLSINQLFLNINGFPKRNIEHVLFSPIPSLALHLQGENEKDPYLDWKKLWDSFA